MSKYRWHPLPIDSQVAAAIEDKKQQFIEQFNQSDHGADDTWYFKHVCVVLDHAKKMFENDLNDMVPDTFKQETHDDAT